MLKRDATYFTPDLILEHNSLCITGKLWMENAPKYFEKIFSHTKNSNSKIFYATFNIEHLNSSSIKQLLEYFKLLNNLKNDGKFEEVIIIWSVPHDDTELIELVNDLAHISELKIDIRKIESSNYTL